MRPRGRALTGLQAEAPGNTHYLCVPARLPRETELMPELLIVGSNPKIPRQDEQADEPGIDFLRRQRGMRCHGRIMLWGRHVYLLGQHVLCIGRTITLYRATYLRMG